MIVGICYLAVGCYLAVIGIIDIKKQEIDIRYLMAGFLTVLITVVMKFIYGEMNIAVCADELGGGLLLGLISVAISFMTKEQLGRADAIVLCQTGLAFGLKGNLLVIGAALLMSLPVALFMTLVKKAGRKSRIPFLPLIFVGFVILMLEEFAGK